VALPKHKLEQTEFSQLKSASYTLTEKGEIIPLDEVALSVQPFPGGSKASGSTHCLANSNRSADDLAITTAKNASSSSLEHFGFQHSYHLRNTNNSSSIYGDGLTTMATQIHQPRRDPPGWPQAASTPHRQSAILTPNTEVTSPIEEVSRAGKIEVDNLPLPTRSAPPVFLPLNNPRILPKMPEVFSVHRYGDRPRM
jgi:hypothetical protein